MAGRRKKATLEAAINPRGCHPCKGHPKISREYLQRMPAPVCLRIPTDFHANRAAVMRTTATREKFDKRMLCRSSIDKREDARYVNCATRKLK